MNLLVIGGGGREHALAWKLAQSPRAARIFVAPGNAGTAREPGLTNVAVTGAPELVAFAQRERVQLAVVGPEAPLAAGVVDASAPRACASSAPPAPPRSSRARRTTPRRSWPGTGFRPPRTDMIAPTPRAARRLRAPTIRRTADVSSTTIAAAATTPGSPAFDVRKSKVPVKP